MKQQVESDPNSIGFVSNYQVETGGVNAVVVQRRRLQQSQLRSPAPTRASARFYEVTKGKATGAAAAFIGWIDTSAAAKKIISSQWIPIS